MTGALKDLLEWLGSPPSPCCAHSSADRDLSAHAALWSDADGDGWLEGARKLPALYRGPRWEPLRECTAIVLHRGHTGGDIARYFATATRELERRRVSAHFVIMRDGTVIQCVPLTHRANHAGAEWNARSIGIEHQGPIDAPYTEAQARASELLIASLCSTYPIGVIVAHSAIAPDRRRDPGPYPWARLERLGVELKR